MPTKDTGEAAPATVETTYPEQEDGSATANWEGTQPTVLSTYPAHPDDDVEEESDMDESQGVYKAVSRGGNDGPSTTAWVVPKAGNTRKAQQGMGQGSLPAMSNGTAEGGVVGPIGLAKSITFEPLQGFPRGEASASFMQHLREGHASHHPTLTAGNAQQPRCRRRRCRSARRKGHRRYKRLAGGWPWDH